MAMKCTKDSVSHILFKKIDFKYDYGLGKCKVNVSAVCIGAQCPMM